MPKIDELILLIGTNPLPNFVTAMYLRSRHKELKRIWFISSDRTYACARRLQTVLKDFAGVKMQHRKIDDIGNSSAIRSTFEDVISEIDSGAGIHLNYTGGTKAMAAHGYQMLSPHEICTFSYLDARTHRLMFDDSVFANSEPLTEKVRISFDDLYHLHGFKVFNRKNEPVFESALALLTQYLQSDQLEQVVSDKPAAYQRKLFVNARGSLAEKPSQIADKDQLEKFCASAALVEVCQRISTDEPLFHSDGTFNRGISNSAFKTAVGFLDGKWLEAYLHQQLQQILDQERFQIESNVELKRPEWSHGPGFELDVLALNGYQIFAASCTIAERKDICKNKGFEVLHRAHQIGGDESRCVLLCGANEEVSEKLQNELEIDTGSEGNENILVLGKAHWKPELLQSELKKYLKVE